MFTFFIIHEIPNVAITYCAANKIIATSLIHEAVYISMKIQNNIHIK